RTPMPRTKPRCSIGSTKAPTTTRLRSRSIRLPSSPRGHRPEYPMRNRFLRAVGLAPFASLAVMAVSVAGCSNPDEDPLGCGEGTERVGHECLPKNRDAGFDAQP